MATAMRAPILTAPSAAWRIEIVHGASAERAEREQRLVAARVPIFFGNRRETDTADASSSFFLSVHDEQGTCAGGVLLRSRAAPLPGHTVVRAERFGSSIPLEAAAPVIATLREWITSQPRVLRLSVDVFSPDESRRARLGEVLAQAGFRRAPHANGYTETAVIDLAGSEDEIFRSLHHSARRKVRQVERLGLDVREVTEASLGPRMNELLEETLARTGGRFRERDWPARIELSRRHPELSRIVGLFRREAMGPDALLAFAWGCHCGDHAYYSEAASTRNTGELRAPLAYALMWDLIVWARRTGAAWFDLGGITAGTHADDDPLGGISDFKRYFTQRVVTVRDEWILDDHSLRATLAAALHRALRR